jgi:cellulose synthase/poly-beta-1,6-N-acetylglucosamine synthase-like glycosyltransferase
MKKKGDRVGICIPSRGEMAIGTAFDLALMAAYDSRFRKGDQAIYTVNGTLIFDQREKLAIAALDEKCDWILWVDADMRFPKNTIERLMRHNKDICGVNATTRSIPVKATAKNLIIDSEEKTNNWSQVSSKGKTGIEKVTSIGCGVMLVKRKVFEKTPQPWFWFYQLPGNKVLGEDVHFCVAAHDAGFETWVDHDLSNEIGHVGSYVYGWKDVVDGDNQLLGLKD